MIAAGGTVIDIVSLLSISSYNYYFGDKDSDKNTLEQEESHFFWTFPNVSIFQQNHIILSPSTKTHIELLERARSKRVTSTEQAYHELRADGL